MGRTVRFPGYPDFNPQDGSTLRKILKMNWGETAVPNTVLVANGGAAGAIASGMSLPAEMYYDLEGRVQGPRDALGAEWRSLLASIPPDRDVPMTVLGGGLDPDLQTWVRRYDKATPTFSSRLDFALHLVATDPYKYALAPISSGVAMFVTDIWFQTYAKPGSVWVDTYAKPATRWVSTYLKAAPSGPYETTLNINSAGRVPSQRVVTVIAGPLTAGRWFLTNLVTGDKCWVNLSISQNQRVTIDTLNRSAALDGSDVSELFFGDWPRLYPGTNTVRLVGVTSGATAAFATITAYEAYE